MQSEHEAAIVRYYSRAESSLGYRLFLGGARHMCYYPPGLRSWNLRRALREMEDLVGDRLDLPAGSKVLDAGCGLGHVARRLAENFDLDVTGIDLLSSHVTVARRLAARSRAGDRLKFEEMSYADLDVPDDTFDGVYTVESLVHAEHLDAVLGELYRVLKPGGRAVFLEFSRAPAEEIAEEARLAFSALNAIDDMPGFQQITHPMLPELLGQAGFTVVNVTDIIERIYPMLWFFAQVGRFPSFAGRVLHLDQLRVSSLSAINIWRYREELAYNVVIAQRPGP